MSSTIGLSVFVSVHFKDTELVTSMFNVFIMICSHFIDDQGLNQRLNLVSVFRSAIVAIHCKLPNVPAVIVNTHPIYHFCFAFYIICLCNFCFGCYVLQG